VVANLAHPQQHPVQRIEQALQFLGNASGKFVFSFGIVAAERW
jgi:hypothetical protein